MLRSAKLATIAALLAACAAGAQVAPLADLASFPRGTVEIHASDSSHRFDVWIAATPERQSQGLMFVRELPPDRGMLFVHDPPRPIGMWMKNTYIELDMLFIADGRIVRIVRRARPHSLQTIESGEAVSAVLELRGGEADRRGISVGSRVSVAGLPQ